MAFSSVLFQRRDSIVANVKTTFNTRHDSLFMVFGVPNAKYLSFGIPNRNALIAFSLVRTMNYTEVVLLLRSELPGKEMDYITDLQK